MKELTREQLQEKINSGLNLTIVEVLPEGSFKEVHLPKAVNVPLNDRFEVNIRSVVPDKNTPVVVYCANEQCPASEEAAKKMEELGYKLVYDYKEGKKDWQKAGLPTES